MHDQPSITRKARNRDLAPVGAPCAFARPAFNHLSDVSKNLIKDTCRAHSHDQPSITRRPVQFSLSSVCAVRIRTTSLQSHTDTDTDTDTDTECRAHSHDQPSITSP